MNEPSTRRYLATDPEFYQALGNYFQMWSAFELTIDALIWRLLKVTAFQAHLIISGMPFTRKARLLSDLLTHSEDPEINVSKIKECLGKAQGTKRDVFAHSYIQSGPNLVTFLERPPSDATRVRKHPFTKLEFLTHVQIFVNAAADFQIASGITDEEITEFADALVKR